MADLPASRTAAQWPQAPQQGQCLCRIHTTGLAAETEQKPSQTPPAKMSSKFKIFLKRSRAWLCQISKVSKTQIKDPGCKTTPQGNAFVVMHGALRALICLLGGVRFLLFPAYRGVCQLPCPRSCAGLLPQPDSPQPCLALPPSGPRPPRPRSLATFLPGPGCSRGRSPASGPSWTAAQM